MAEYLHNTIWIIKFAQLNEKRARQENLLRGRNFFFDEDLNYMNKNQKVQPIMPKQTHGLLANQKSKNVVGNEVGKGKGSLAPPLMVLEIGGADGIGAQTVNIAMSKANMAVLYEDMPQQDIIIFTFNISTKIHRSLDTIEKYMIFFSTNDFVENADCKIYEINRNAKGYPNIQNFFC